MAKLANMWISQERYMVPLFSLHKLKIRPPVIRPAIAKEVNSIPNHPIIIDTWYNANAAELRI